MASSTTAASTARPLDPLRQSKYTLHVSDSLLSKPRESSAFSTVRYNYKPKLSSSSIRTAAVSAIDDERVNLILADKSGDGESKYTYTGRRKDLKRSYALVFNQSNQTCTMEPISSSFTFNIKSTPSEPSAAKLAERYPKLKPRMELGKGRVLAAGDEEGANPNEPADESNPYDFRHFVRRARDASRSASPDAMRSSANTPSYGPKRLTSSHRSNLADSSPVATPRQTAAKPRRSSPPAGKTLSKSKTSDAPTVRLERRATSRVTKSQPSKKIKSITQPKKNPTVKSDYFVHSSSEDDLEPLEAPSGKSAGKASALGGLEIDLGDSATLKPQSRVSTVKSKRNRGLDTPDSGPISLRSAANSTTASPAHGMRPNSSLLRVQSMGDGQVIDFGDTSAVENDSDEDADSDMDAAGDEDVDIEPMTLGSPAHEQSRTSLRDHKSQDRESRSEGDADADAENDADFADAFEDAIKEFEDEVEPAPTGGPAAAGDESEESEEE